MLNYTIEDDRGKPVPLCDFTKAGLRNARPTRTPHDAEIMIAARRWFPVLAALFILLYLVPSALNMILVSTSSPGLGSIKPTLVLILLGYIIFATRPKRKKRTAFDEDARRSLIRATACPSCGYSLRDVTPEADGCTVCPECGAAWRLQ